MTYKKATLKNYVNRMNNLIKEYSEKAVETLHVSISKGNQKIGRVMNVSLPPIHTCANCSGCKFLCYDIKACLAYPSAIKARAKNLVLLRKDRERFFREIATAMQRRRKNFYFRFHVAGDIVDADYFERMVKLARLFPHFTIWTYTKNYSVVNGWIKENGKDSLPANLHVMYSEWRGMEMVNPYNMPEFRVVFKTDENKPDPKKVFYCPGNCDVCKASGRGCLAGETVYCNEH